MDAVVIGTIVAVAGTILIFIYFAYRFFVIIGKGDDEG